MLETSSIESTCFHNKDGYCMFLLSEYLDPETRQPCELCWNWKSARPDMKTKLRVKRPLADYWDLVRRNPSVAKMFDLKPLKPLKPL